MIRPSKHVRAQAHKVLDATLFCVGLFLAHTLRNGGWIPLAKIEFLAGVAPSIQPFREYVWLFMLIFPVSPFLLDMFGYYVQPTTPSRPRQLWILVRATGLLMLIVAFALTLTKQDPSRAVVLFLGPISMCLMLLKEEIFLRLRRMNAGQSQFERRFVLVGTAADSVKLQQHIKEKSPEGVRIVAEINLNEHSIDDLIQALHDHTANGVLLAAKHTYFGQIEKAIQACEVEGVEAWLLADFFNTQFSQTILDDFGGKPMLVFRRTPDESWQRLAKQVIDTTGALLFLILLSPFFLLFALAIKILTPGPIFFRQKRSGLHGRPFTMYKFRSMATNAEQRKQEIAMFNEMSGPVFKVTNDPRVTPLGKFLRKYSFDEWPQMINVLKGEMSLVGPRPLPVDETLRFSDLAHRRRLSVRPGLTCLWQISGRSNVKDFRDWVRLDLEYIDNWTLWLDLKILLLTLPAVLRGTGAR